MTSHYYEFQVLLIPRLLQSLVVTLWGVGGDLYACVWLCVCVLICVKGVCWRKEVCTKKGGSIIGSSAARRHNDTAIDSGMSSRERWTNGGAGVCFSQPLIGWLGEAVGLQVAKWTSEHICHPSASWRREGALDVEEKVWPLWREGNNWFTCTQHVIFCLFPLHSSLLHQTPFSFPHT